MSWDVERAAKALEHAVGTTFELMAFLEIEPSQEATEPELLNECVWAQVSVLFPGSGDLTLALAPGFAEETAKLLHCEDSPEVNPVLIADAVGEFANTIAGRCLAALVAAGETFQLDLPIAGDAMPAGELKGAVRHFFDVNQKHVLSAALRFDDEAEE